MTNQLKAYAMYDMGDGFMWNEVAFRDNIIDNPNGPYKAHAVRIYGARFDNKRAELKLIVEKEGYGSQYPLMLVNATARRHFFNDVGTGKTDELVGKRAIGLFQNNVLEWFIAYSHDVTQDDINQTKIDAGDYSFLKDKGLDDLL